MEEHLGTIASLIGSLTVVGSALIWIYNKFIGGPREARRAAEEEERHTRMLKVITKENEPLNRSIKQLTEWLNESKQDRENLNRMSVKHSGELDDHERRLDEHQERLTVLEVLNGIRKKEYAYQGGEK